MKEIIVSKDFKNNQLIDGRVGFSNLSDAFRYADEKSIIYLQSEEYFSKLFLDKPYITIIGKKDGSSVINYNANNSKIISEDDGGDGIKTYGTTGSATFTVLPAANNFTMVNVAIKNSYHRTKEQGTQAVAMKTEAFDGEFINCRFISSQDTLYVEGNNNKFINCYICGDVDFIFGSGDAIFERCEIEVLDIDGHAAYLCAPNTFKQYKFGYFFYRCQIKHDGQNKVYLGRPWYPRGAKFFVEPRCAFLECKFPSTMNLEFIQMHDGDPKVHKLYVINCFKDGKLIVDEQDDDIKEKYLNHFKNEVL